MSNQDLASFPTGEFAAFSTTKMANFLPYSEKTTMTMVKAFFGADYGKKADVINERLVVLGSEGWAPVEYGKIIARFVNKKYKIIDGDYYRRNFNAPIIDEQGQGIH
ncbi:hypothetical protein [Lapidilactobacillus salsurivasis]